MTTGMYVFAYACSLVLINHKQKRLCELCKGESNIQYSRAGDREMEAISENFFPVCKYCPSDTLNGSS